MKSLLFSLSLLFSVSVFANTQIKPLALHDFNSKVAKLLDFNKSSNFNKISKNLSAKDKVVFQKLLARKKAQKVKLFPFMSFLYIKDSKKQIAIEVVSIKPLQIRVDGGKRQTIDLKNIRGSFPKWKEQQVSKWWSWVIPEAQAFCIWDCDSESTSDDWELLYGYAASSEVYAGWEPVVTDTDSRIVANETAGFVNEFGITKVNCAPKKYQSYNNENRRYVEVVRQDGGRTILECDSFQNNCRTFPVDDKGELQNTSAEKSEIDHAIISNVIGKITEDLQVSRINPNALDISCDENSCHLVASQNGNYADSISAGTMEKISAIDLGSVGDSSMRGTTEELLEKYKAIDRIHNTHYPKEGGLFPPENRGKAMYAMMACCSANECVKHVNDRGRVQFNTSPTDDKGVSQ